MKNFAPNLCFLTMITLNSLGLFLFFFHLNNAITCGLSKQKGLVYTSFCNWCCYQVFLLWQNFTDILILVDTSSYSLVSQRQWVTQLKKKNPLNTYYRIIHFCLPNEKKYIYRHTEVNLYFRHGSCLVYFWSVFWFLFPRGLHKRSVCPPVWIIWRLFIKSTFAAFIFHVFI